MSDAISGGGVGVVPDVASLIRATCSTYPAGCSMRHRLVQFGGHDMPLTGNPGQCRFYVKTNRATMQLSKVAALALIVGAASLMSASLARAASDCSISATLADWG